MAIIIHQYPEQKLRKLAVNEDANCETCALAEKMDVTDKYLCKAALYDIKTLACHVERMDGGADK